MAPGSSGAPHHGPPWLQPPPQLLQMLHEPQTPLPGGPPQPLRRQPQGRLLLSKPSRPPREALQPHLLQRYLQGLLFLFIGSRPPPQQSSGPQPSRPGGTCKRLWMGRSIAQSESHPQGPPSRRPSSWSRHRSSSLARRLSTYRVSDSLSDSASGLRRAAA